MKSIPQFHYWHIVLQLELLALVYVSSLRVGNFPLYISSLEKIAQWCFALDHTNYARWLPIHINDMLTLESRHPSVYQEFNKGNFVVFKSKKKFSAMAIDQAHEQNNALVKGDGGAVGLTESPNALLRWMVAGPETARVIQEFQSGSTKTQKTTDSSFQHHEMSRSAQLSFDKEVKDLVGVFSELGNPFLEKSEDILVLDTKTIADPGMLDTVQQIEKVGETQYKDFVKDRLHDKKSSVYDTIKRNKFPIFMKNKRGKPTKTQAKVSALKSDCSLFSRLYVACQVRDGNLDDFFAYENHAYPPSLSDSGG